MSQSKYPNKFDTSVELPQVRDNTLSDPINSLRSAIFQIEKTLGINPQGVVGNTVASRIGKSLDANGNILPEALNLSGILTGPITNNEVSAYANIKESKLDLNFPTKLLQDEISVINNELTTIESQLEILIGNLSAHLSVNATNRHPATAISVTGNTATPSDESSLNLETGSVQSALDALYNAHINYSGANIASDNNSHRADQVYFDDSYVSDIISGADLQSVVEDTILLGRQEKNTHQDTQHSNGILRVGKLSDVSRTDISEILASNISASFTISNGNSNALTKITLLDSVDISNYSLSPFDFVIIEDEADTENIYNGVYEIYSYNVTSNTLNYLYIYGLLNSNSTSTTKVTIGKNIEKRTNQAGLLVTATEEATLTSSRIFQVSNPNATRIISQNINPAAITTSNRYVVLTIDDIEYTLDVYNSNTVKQSIDSIIRAINEQLVESHANALAYRLDYETGTSEIAIIHNLPDEDNISHTFIISRGADDAIDSLGFSNIEDLENKNLYGTEYFINGKTYTDLALKIKTTDFVYFAGSNLIGIGNSSTDFISLGIKIGDMVIITNAASSSDNGSYYISQITSSQIRLDSGQLSLGFSDNSDEGTTTFYIYSNSSSLDDLTFDKVSSSYGAALIETFLDKNRNLNYYKLLEYSAEIVGTQSLVDIVDYIGENVYDTSLNLIVSEDPDNAAGILISLDSGKQVAISGDNQYVWISSGTTDIKLKLYISDVDAVSNKISAGSSDLEFAIYLFGEVNSETNLILSRSLYHNYNGRLSGGIGAARFISKLSIGNINSKDISNQLKKDLVETPFADLRYNGVISGLEISSPEIVNSYYQFDLTHGIVYINGKRISIDSRTNVLTDINSGIYDKFYILLDEDGNLRFDTSLDGTCTVSYGDAEYCLLGSIEYDNTNLDVIDQRLFIDNLDLKLLNAVTVSPHNGMAHFTDPIKAIQYAKRFSEIFPKAGTPSVHFKSGYYELTLDYTYNETSGTHDPTTSGNLATFYNQQITSGYFLNFPIIITGEGYDTEIKLINKSTYTDIVYSMTMPIVICGSTFTAPTHGFDNFTTGSISIRDLRLTNTRIICVDPAISVSGTEQIFDINIENIFFDFEDFGGVFIDGSHGPRAIEILEINDTTNNKGNINIKDCTFIKAGIYCTAPSRIKNLSIINNIYHDDDDTTHFLFNDLYSFSTVNSASNVNIIGNRHASNLSANGASGPQMVASSSLTWGDRFSRDIRVGSDGYFGDSTEVVNHYKYNSAKTFEKIWYATDLTTAAQSGTDVYWSGAGTKTLTMQAYTAGGKTVKFPYFTIPSNAIRFKIDLPYGAVITQISIGHDGGVDLGTDVTLTLYSLARTGGNSVLGTSPITSLDSDVQTISTVLASGISTLNFDISATINTKYHQLVEINHNDGVNDLNFYWISVTMDISNVESGIGLA